MTRMHRFAVALALVLAGGGVARAQDPGTLGAAAVSTETYSFGTYTPDGYPHSIELKGQIKYPTALDAGPYPVAVLLHGRHSTCYAGTTPYQEWPCAAGHTPIDSYKGYDYLGDLLASNGIITISVSVNGINAYDNTVADFGMSLRAQTLQKHLDELNRWNTVGGYSGPGDPNRFIGAIDLTRVATMGHSRGGEGVVTHYNLNKSLGSPYGILGVVPLAPVDFKRLNTGDASLLVVLGYCDGDVADLQGVHYFDDVRYTGATRARYAVDLMGANHNYFNTVWTDGIGPSTHAADDWSYEPVLANDTYCSRTQPSNKRLSAAQQRAAGGAYMAAFFRTVLNGEDFTPWLTGDFGVPPSASFTDRPIYSWYHAADARRRDVNRLLVASHLVTNQLGGAVTATAVNPDDLCGGASPEPQYCLAQGMFSDAQFRNWQPHQTPSALATTVRGLSVNRFAWNGAAGVGQITNAIPAGSRDVTGFDSLQFRAGVNWQSAANTAGVDQDMTVTLSDGVTSASTVVSATSVSGQLYFPPGDYYPRVLLNTIRLPLTAFAGIDFTQVRAVTFTFDQSTSGALLVSDIAFTATP